ncbi:hypothetical protein ACEQ8H_007479 [Pleosporales sp. CAS-2024a]
MLDASQASQSSVTPKKRTFKEVYTASSSEQFPDLPWYGIDYQDIIETVTKMLNEVMIPLEKYAPTDSGIESLLKEAEKVKAFPDLKKCHMAVLGDQGAGKSTLLTALFSGRNLLDRSGGTKSCTAVPIIVTHKKGAADNTKESDVTIEWFNAEDILAHILEQVRHWTDVFPGLASGLDAAEEAGDEEEVEETSDDSEFESETEDCSPQAPPKLTKKLYNSLKQDAAASTAKEFFQVVFDAQHNEHANQELEKWLYETDIREGGFADLCMAKVKDRFQYLDQKLRIRNDVSTFLHISDRDLKDIRQIVTTLWPFVRVVSISTGHILLRYGMCFYDLPGNLLHCHVLDSDADNLGFGDTNQLREANINRYRWKADLELIVADSSRIRTNKKLNKQIATSLHLKRGDGRTILVMNKTDTLLDKSNIGDQIWNIQEHPFPALQERLNTVLKEQDDDQDEDGIELEDFDSLCSEIDVAYVKRETRLVREHFRGKNIIFFAVSATSFLQWNQRMRAEDPLLPPEATGIPGLIRHLLITPASTNFNNYNDHVTRIMNRFRARAARVIQKHVEDQQYARMRQDLAAQTPLLEKKFNNTFPKLIEDTAIPPWSPEDEPEIHEKIKDLFQQQWKHPIIWYHGWWKMLRENGVPCSGAYHDQGRNLNEDILGTVEPSLEEWFDNMTFGIDGIAEELQKLAEDFVDTVRRNIDICTTTPDLKDAAVEALDEVSESIHIAYDKLLSDLSSSLEENHLRFTTEIDIECPIAQAMKPSYNRALDERFVKDGKGVYNRQRRVLQTSMLKPKKHYFKLGKQEERIKPLLDTLKSRLMSRQQEMWKTDCATFTDAVIDHLVEFSVTTEELLVDATFMAQGHQEARAELKKLLVFFDEKLEEVQAEFANAESHCARKKAKVEAARASRVSTRPAESAYQNAGVPVCRMDDTVPVVPTFGRHKGVCPHPLWNF